MHKKKAFQTGNVLLISAAHLVHDTYTAFLNTILPLLIEKLSISLTLSGLLAVIQRIPSLLNPFIGILADRVRIRYLIIFSPALTAISMSLIGMAPGYTLVAILLLVSGISSTFFHVPTPVMIKRISGEKVGMGMGFYMMGGEFARTLGPLVILGAIELWGLEGIFRLIPLGILASAILFIKFKNMDLRKDFKPEETTIKSYGKTFRRFMPIFLISGGIIFFQGAMKSSLTLYLTKYLTDKGNDIWFAGKCLSVLQLAGVAGSFFSGAISDKIGRKTTLILAVLGSPVLMWFFTRTEGIALYPLLAVTGLFLFAHTPVLMAIIHEIKTDHLPFVNGVYMTINFFISSLMVLVVGFLGDKIGLELTYTYASFFAILAIIPVLLFKKSYLKRE